AMLVERGMPNRFGAQRFGREGDNAERGRAVLEGRLRPRDRREARFWVSALQAAVFNEALDRREAPLDAVEPGDVAEVVATGGLFRVEDLAREAPRAARFEISATGPIFGRDARTPRPAGAPAAREAAALAAFGVDEALLARAPRGLRIAGARRPLRVPVREASLSHAGDALTVRFVLPPGAYATVLVEALVGPCEEGPIGADAGLSAPVHSAHARCGPEEP